MHPMADAPKSSMAFRLVLKTLLNIGVVWVLATFLNQYFQLTGGAAAYVIVGALITLMNIFVRPVLAVITAPLKLFATILAIIIVNGVFVQLTHIITIQMDPNLVQLEIFGGAWGWTVVALAFGVSNWIIKEIFK